MSIPLVNSFDSVIKKLQKIYQQQTTNDKTATDKTNSTTGPALDPNWLKGSPIIADTKDVIIIPTSNALNLTIDEVNIPIPVDVEYLYQTSFKLPKQYLGFLGYENYWSVNGSDTLQAGSIFTAKVLTPDIYQINGDGTQLWLGPNPPTNYLSILDYTLAQQALYNAPAWEVTVPSDSPHNGPLAGKYHPLGFIAVLSEQGKTNSGGNYGIGQIFIASSVTNISGGSWTGGGMLLTNSEKSAHDIILAAPVVPGVPANAVVGTWPPAWIWPQDLFYTQPGLPAHPGQTVIYGGGGPLFGGYVGGPNGVYKVGIADGAAIYQAYYPQFVTPGIAFVGITFEARFPTVAQFITAGLTSAEANLAYTQLYNYYGNDLGGGTIVNSFNDPGQAWDNIRTPGDMWISGLSSAALTIAFNLMWAHYSVGTNASWVASGGTSYLTASAAFTYNVTETVTTDQLRFMMLSPIGSGATFSITADTTTGAITGATVVSAGSGYFVGTVLQIQQGNSSLGVPSGATLTVTGLTPNHSNGGQQTSMTSGIGSVSISAAGKNYVTATGVATADVLNLTPGFELVFPAVNTITWYYGQPFFASPPTYLNVYYSMSGWTSKKLGWRAYYDSNCSTPLFVADRTINAPNTDTGTPNIQRPDQHQSLNAFLLLGSSLYDQPSFNIAGAFYWFPYSQVELFVNPDPYPKWIPVNTAVIDNSYDPMYVKLSKSTDKQERWGVFHRYSAVVMTPSVQLKTSTYLKWHDVTNFEMVKTSSGYNIVANEGSGPKSEFYPGSQPGFANATGPIENIGGPLNYTDSVPNTTSHSTTPIQVYGPQPNKITTRVKVMLKTPNNWHQVKKFGVKTS
jgi:hypothetical protein